MRWRPRSRTWSRRRAICCRCCWSARRCAMPERCTTARVAIHRGRLLGVVPKVHLPNYREFYEPRHFVVGRRDRRAARSPSAALTRAVRHRPAVRGRGPAGLRSSTPRSARTSGCPMPPSSRGGAGRRDGARQPVGQQHHDRQGGDAAAAVRARNRRAAWRPISTPRRGRANPPPISPGTARPRSSRTARRWPRPSVSRRPASSPSPTSTSTCCARSACRWAPSTPTAAAIPRSFRRIGFRLDPPAGDIGLRAQGRALSVRAGRSRAARAGLLRGLQHPGLRPGAAAARHRDQAGGDRRLGRARFHPCADRCGQALDLLGLPRGNILAYTMPGFATSDAHQGATPWRLMEALGVTGEEIDIRPAAERRC